ncbi:MAG: sigma-70 family RNA polymerase sigma factor [Terriglobia bacterium]
MGEQPAPDRITGRASSTDLDLIHRVMAGDETALASLYDRYSGIVYSVARRILNDDGAAEEVLQDIFYQLWRTASNFDESRGGLTGWLLVSARNRAIDRLRHHKSSEGLDEERPVAVKSNLESQVAQSELMGKVKGSLLALPEAQRAALELAYFEGLTHTEIAERTGEPLGTIKTRLRSALQTLRQALNP